jgi:polysaccharide deacetylase 2 family uncharacterized protein YibQ
MARRRSGRSLARVLALVALCAATFALGLWFGRERAPAPRAPSAGAPERAPAPARPRVDRRAPAPPVAAPAEPGRPPAEPTEVARPAGPAPQARVALVIDDLGRSLAEADRLLALGAPVSAAVLPFEPRSAAVARRLRAAGAEVLVHLPMEAADAADPGPNAIYEGLDAETVARRTGAAIDAVPGAAGVNNHMGSRATADEATMVAILGVVAERGLYFLDSRTTPDSLAFDRARARGVPAARRDVFLDDDPSPEAVRAQLERLLALARERGAAVAIGHPREATLAVLEQEIPRARAAGIEFVPVSYLLERSETLPE